MTNALVHRGPDSEGQSIAAGCGLGIRRLRVIDLDTGDQPIANEDATVHVVLNGEIYNFEQLREQLIAQGHVFRTRSDTECIVHAYEQYGDACVEHLRGMFALAVWDERLERLLLARDRFGKKPLFYRRVNRSLTFASELQALFQSPAPRPTVGLGATGDYFAYGYIPGPQSIYEGVEKLLPGHTLVWQAGEITVQRYWRLQYEPKRQMSEPEALDELERLITEAVRLRLMSDVPLGALLSGGVDSSIVVALMARNTSRPVKTFSIGFDESGFSELVHARRVAHHYHTEHHELVVRADVADILPLLAQHYGEPYADSSAIPTFYVSQLARRHVTVALNGDGGDEAFAGYDRYRAMVLADRLQAVPGFSASAGGLGRELAERSRMYPKLRRAARFVQAAGEPSDKRWLQWTSAVPDQTLNGILQPDAAAEIARQRSFSVQRAFSAHAALGLVDRMLATDVDMYLANDTLVKMDIASMANSLECRSPLLDQEVMRFAASLPANMKLHHGFGQKHLLKRLAYKLIPRANIERPKKGFGVPVGEWLRGALRPLAHSVLSEADATIFRQDAVAAIWHRHQERAADNATVLWTILMYELWRRHGAHAASVPADCSV